MYGLASHEEIMTEPYSSHFRLVELPDFSIPCPMKISKQNPVGLPNQGLFFQFTSQPKIGLVHFGSAQHYN